MTDTIATKEGRSPLNKLKSFLRGDGWENIVTGLGTARDKRLGGRIVKPDATRTFSEVEAIYLGDDLADTMASRPAKDMVRRWIALSVDQTPTDGDDARRQLDTGQDPAKLMQTFLRDFAVPPAFMEAKLWANVFGGSVAFMGFDDGAATMADPLNENNLQSFSHLTVFDRFDVRIATYQTDPKKPRFSQPETYMLNEHVLPGGVIVPDNLRTIHASRMLRFDGVKTTRRRRRENNGWDDSIYEKRKDILRDYNLAWGGVAHLIEDFGQFVLKIKGLADMLAEDQDQLVIDRMMNLDFTRSTVRGIVLDAEMEDAERMTTPVTGLDKLMLRFDVRYAAAAGIPVTLLFGTSPAGLNATGESDLINYYDQIHAAQEVEFRPNLTRLIDLLWKTAEGPTRGKVPASYSYVFNPLWALDDKEEAERRKAVGETDVAYIEQGVLDPDEVRESRFGGDSYSIETVLQEREAGPAAPTPDAPATPGGLPAFDYIDTDLPEFGDVEQWRWDQEREDQDASKVQTLIFAKSRFPSAGDATDWAKSRDFRAHKVDETGQSFRLRQRDPSDFTRGSLRTIQLTNGVQAVIGRPK